MCWWSWLTVPLKMPIKPYWREGTFLIVLLKVGQSLSLRLPILMTLEGFFDHLMHFVHWHCALAIADTLPLLFVEAFTGTLCNACTPTSRVFRKTQVSFWLCRCISQCQSLLHLFGPRTYWFARLPLSFYEALKGTALRMWNLREQNEDNSRWHEE